MDGTRTEAYDEEEEDGIGKEKENDLVPAVRRIVRGSLSRLSSASLHARLTCVIFTIIIIIINTGRVIPVWFEPLN